MVIIIVIVLLVFVVFRKIESNSIGSSSDSSSGSSSDSSSGSLGHTKYILQNNHVEHGFATFGRYPELPNIEVYHKLRGTELEKYWEPLCEKSALIRDKFPVIYKDSNNAFHVQWSLKESKQFILKFEDGSGIIEDNVVKVRCFFKECNHFRESTFPEIALNENDLKNCIWVIFKISFLDYRLYDVYIYYGNTLYDIFRNTGQYREFQLIDVGKYIFHTLMEDKIYQIVSGCYESFIYETILYEDNNLKSLYTGNAEFFYRAKETAQKKFYRTDIIDNGDSYNFYFFVKNKYGIIILEYLQDKYSVEKLPQILPDDYTANYKVTIKKNNIDDLRFIYRYMGPTIGVGIYEQPISYYLKGVDFVKAPIVSYSNTVTYNDAILNKEVLKDIYDKCEEKYNDEKLPDKISLYPSDLEMYYVLDTAFPSPNDKYDERDKEKYKYYTEKAIDDGLLTVRWKSEYELYKTIINIYPDAIFQYKSQWLEGQSLDIFIPSLNIGIEYQGKQHYEAVKLFGGEEGLKQTQLRDKKKRQKCAMNNVTLIEWPYSDKITPIAVKKRISLFVKC